MSNPAPRLIDQSNPRLLPPFADNPVGPPGRIFAVLTGITGPAAMLFPLETRLTPPRTRSDARGFSAGVSSIIIVGLKYYRVTVV